MGFLYSQLFITPKYPTTSYSNKTVIVTGSNVGLGLEAARHFLRLDAAKVILAVRSVSKGQAAVENLTSNSPFPDPARIEVWQLDLSSYASVKAFGARVQKMDRLDVVVENAGILTDNYSVLEDNESVITVNVVSTVLLGLLVLPKLRESARKYGTQGKLVFVGSDLHLGAAFTEKDVKGMSLFDALNGEKTANMGDRYPTSKLLLYFATKEMGARSPFSSSSPVVINHLTPGACQSDIWRDDNMKSKVMNVASKVFGRTTEVGSRTLVNAASAGEESHGKFLWDDQVHASSAFADGPAGAEIQKKFWGELMEKLERTSPGISNVL